MEIPEQIHRDSLSSPTKKTLGSQKVSPARIYGYLTSLSAGLRAWVKGHGQSELVTEAKHHGSRENLEPVHSTDASNVPRSCIASHLDIVEVSFDGDQDPMSPRSMPRIRKWIVVIVVCTGTLCV